MKSNNCKTCLGAGMGQCGKCVDCGGSGLGPQAVPECRVTCGCCAGSGQYLPLTGPAQPCDTCKGEKTVPAPNASFDATTGMNQLIDHKTVGEQRSHRRHQAESRVIRESRPVKVAIINMPNDEEVLAKLKEKQAVHEALNAAMVEKIGDESNSMPYEEKRGRPSAALHPAVEAAFERGELSYGACILMSQLPRDLQVQHMAVAIAGCNMFKQIEKARDHYRAKNDAFRMAFGGVSELKRGNQIKVVLHPEVSAQIDDGQLSVHIAHLLGKLSPELQLESINDAKMACLYTRRIEKAVKDYKRARFARAYGQNAIFAKAYGTGDEFNLSHHSVMMNNFLQNRKKPRKDTEDAKAFFDTALGIPYKSNEELES